MNYTPITEENVEKAATLYMNHYNQHSGGCWTYEKAYKRIHQMVTMEDSPVSYTHLTLPTIA